MPKNLEGETVRLAAEEIPATSAEDLTRMLAMPDEAIDTSDIPERTGQRRRLRRDSEGRLPGRRSAIRETIAAAMAERELTAYALWKEAKVHCPTISETAVGEFLKGRRSIGIEYLEAIIGALGLAFPSDRRYTESKVDGTVLFMFDDPSRLPHLPPTPIGKPHDAVIHLVEFRFDKETTTWFGAAEVACDVMQVTREATAAGMVPVAPEEFRDLLDYLMQVRLADGRRGATRITKSRGQFDGTQHHRVDFVGLSKLVSRNGD